MFNRQYQQISISKTQHCQLTRREKRNAEKEKYL